MTDARAWRRERHGHGLRHGNRFIHIYARSAAWTRSPPRAAAGIVSTYAEKRQ